MNNLCYCDCHQHPGAYRNEPCGVCNHFNSKGMLNPGYGNGWREGKSEQEITEYAKNWGL